MGGGSLADTDTDGNDTNEPSGNDTNEPRGSIVRLVP
jgi:hypothetical protein